MEVPVATVRWLAQRDAHAERMTACYLDQGLDLARAEQALSVVEKRPSWGVVVGLTLGGAAAGLVVGAALGR